jgi:hypothetical protein
LATINSVGPVISSSAEDEHLFVSHQRLCSRPQSDTMPSDGRLFFARGGEHAFRELAGFWRGLFALDVVRSERHRRLRR